MKVRRNVALLVVLLIAVGLLAGGLWAPSLAQKPVKIGVLTPLSPPGDAAAGQFIVRGAKMAADDVNARGGVLGRKIELVVEDDSGTPEKGSAGMRKLASQDQVVAVVGQFHSSVTAAVQVLAEQFQVPVFLTQASAKSLTEKHLNYTFRTHVIDPDRVTMWNRWIKERGYKRVAIMAENTDYGIGLVEDTKKTLGSAVPGSELKAIVFDRAVVDFTPQLLEIKNWKPDVLLNIGIGAPVYLISKQAWDVGLSPAVPMLISYDAPARAEYWKNLGREGQLRLVHRLLPPQHEAADAGRRLPQEVHRAVQGGADLRRVQRLRAGLAGGRRASTRPRARSRTIWSRRCWPASSRAGTAPSASPGARARTGSSGRRRC